MDLLRKEITSISLGQINGIYISVCHGVWHTFGRTEGIFTLVGTFPSLHELCRLGARDFFTNCWYLYHYDLAYALRTSRKIFWTLMSLMPICADLHFVSLNINNHLVILCYFLLLLSNDLQVVVCEGAVREKPSSKEEVLQFLKGLLNSQLPPLFFFLSPSLVSCCFPI